MRPVTTRRLTFRARNGHSRDCGERRDVSAGSGFFSTLTFSLALLCRTHACVCVCHVAIRLSGTFWTKYSPFSRKKLSRCFNYHKSEPGLRSSVMQTGDRTGRSRKSEMCTYKLHFTFFPLLASELFPHAALQPTPPTARLIPDVTRFISPPLREIFSALFTATCTASLMEGVKRRKAKGVICDLLRLIPTALQGLLSRHFYLNIIMKYDEMCCLFSLTLASTRRFCWQVLTLWNNTT